MPKKSDGTEPRARAPPVSDARFARVHTDPRFRRPKHEDSKVVLDDRFKSVLDPRSKNDGPGIDRFGRRRNRGGDREREELERLYRVDDDESSDDEPARVDLARGEGNLESSSEEESDTDEADGDEDEDEDVLLGTSDAVRRARKAGAADVDLDEDEDIDLSDDAVLDADAVAELDREAAANASSAKKRRQKGETDDVERGDDSCRLAVVNLDWDHVHARDLFKVFASVVSPTATRDARDPAEAEAPLPHAKSAHMAIAPVRGQILSVRVYPSDFGKERMALEDRQGPPKEIFKSAARGKKGDADTDLMQVDEGGEFDEDALRKYQLDRLRYYYAVATFDSKYSARHVYNEIDGTEMERSANMFDLRFVPDDMEFPDGQGGRPAEFREEATSDMLNYKGLDFKTDVRCML